MATYTTQADGNLSSTSTYSGSPNVYPGQPQAILDITNDGSGKLKVKISGIASPVWTVSGGGVGVGTGDRVRISGVVGTTEANSASHTLWLISAYATSGGNTFLTLSADTSGTTATFTHTYVSGGVAIRPDYIDVHHNLVADVPTTLGTDFSASFTIQAGASMTVSTGINLTLIRRGFLYGAWTQAAGSFLTFDGVTGYAADIVQSGTSASFTTSGTNLSHVTITASNVTQSGQIWNNSQNGAYSLSYTDISYLQGFIFYGNETGIAFSHVAFATCNEPIKVSNGLATGTNFSLDWVTCVGSTGTYSLNVIGVSSPTGARSITNCGFDLQTHIQTPFGFTFSVAVLPTPNLTGAVGTWASMDGCVLFLSNASLNINGPITNGMVLYYAPSAWDPNVLTVSDFSPAGSIALTGNIFQCCSLGGGALIYTASTASFPSPVSLAINHNIVLLNAGSTTPTSSGDIWDFVNAYANLTVAVDHNTVNVDCSGDSRDEAKGMVWLSDTGEGPGSITHTLTSCRSNFAWANTTNTNALLLNQGNGSTNDIAVPSMVGWNGTFNCVGSDTVFKVSLPGYGDPHGAGFGFSVAPLANGTAGAGRDITADMRYVDKSRDVSTAWTALLGHMTTGTYAGDWLATIGAMTADPSKIATVRNWIRDGFAPTNSVYKNAAHDGLDTGAVAGVFGGILTTAVLHSFTRSYQDLLS